MQMACCAKGRTSRVTLAAETALMTFREAKVRSSCILRRITSSGYVTTSADMPANAPKESVHATPSFIRCSPRSCASAPTP